MAGVYVPGVISNLYYPTRAFSVDGIVGVNLKLHSRPSLADVIDVSAEDYSIHSQSNDQ
jgi:hypothetical protein